MKKLSIVCLAVVMAVAFGFGSAFAANAKVSAVCGDVSAVAADGEWHPIFTQDIRTPANWDLFIDVSLECGLTTDTTVVSKALARELAEAEAVVMVRVLVDPGIIDKEKIANPGEITFARRHQTLIARFAGDISGAISVDPETGVVTIDLGLIEPEMLRLILDTMAAHSFNFIVPDVSVGDHKVVVQAKLYYLPDPAEYVPGDTAIDPVATSAAATAYLGKGSVTIEEVRMIKGVDVVEDLQ